MTDETTKAERLRLAAVDKAVLDEARHTRAHEQQMANIETERQVRLRELADEDARDRRVRTSEILVGVALVVVLAIITAIWTAMDRDRQKQIKLEQVRQETAQQCIRAGNIWVNGNCVLTQRPTGPAGS